MRFTNKTIATTKNNALRTILTNMKPQIAKGIEMVVAQEEASMRDRRPGYKVNEFGRNSIELGLIFDLYKSVVSYTKNSDEVKNFESGLSIKGNFQLSGTIIRDGEEHSFYCEAIIADGAINRRHFRYITKTSLPKGEMVEAKKVKEIIKKNNKINSIQSYIDTLIEYREDAQKKYDEGIKLTREEWKQILIEEDNWLEDNWDDIYVEGFHIPRGWNTKADYMAWINEANEDSIDSKIRHLEMHNNRANRLVKSIAKEQAKLEKAKAM